MNFHPSSGQTLQNFDPTAAVVLRKANSAQALHKDGGGESEEETLHSSKVRPSSTLDALSLEQQLVWRDGRITETYTVRRFQVPDLSVRLVEELVDDILDFVVDVAERKRREQIVENYLVRAIPALLVSHQEVQELGHSLGTASLSLQSSTVRLRAAWKLILVSAAQQLCLSFRRILYKHDCELQYQLEKQGLQPRSLLTDSSQGLIVRLIKERCKIYLKQEEKKKQSRARRDELIGLEADVEELKQSLEEEKDNIDDENAPLLSGGEATEIVDDFIHEQNTEEQFHRALVQYFDHDEDERSQSDMTVETVSNEAFSELQEVTDRILNLAVEYLKNATHNVVEEATQEIKEIAFSRL